MYNSFEQCNNALYDMEELNLREYLDIIHAIPYDHDLNRYSFQLSIDSKWLESIIEFLIEVAEYDPRAFSIQLNSLPRIGIDAAISRNAISSFVHLLVNNRDDDLKKERRFLQSYKLIENIDYNVVIIDIDGDSVEIRHDITRIALYRIISQRYGIRFLEALLSRMGQILFFFSEYKRNFKSKYIESLRRTINDLNQDVGFLTSEIKKNNEKRTIPMIEPCKSYDVDNQYETNSSSTLESNEVMHENDYPDELSTIHNLIETSINRVDNRISDINIVLSNITSKIDDLVESISLTAEDRNSLLSQTTIDRSSMISNASSYGSANSFGAFRDSIDNPVMNHVETIFREYHELSITPPIETTEQSTEHHF